MAVSRTRSEGLSIFRISLIVGVFGILLVGAGVVAFFLDQNSRRAPLTIEPFPNALVWGESSVRPTSRNLFFLSDGEAEEVAAYYQLRLNEFYGDTVEQCVRIPPEGMLAAAPGDVRSSPFQYTCMFDNSGFNATQSTRVVIYPGQYDPDPTLNAEGRTIIKYEQLWQR